MLLMVSVLLAAASVVAALVDRSPLALLGLPPAALLGAWAYTSMRPETGQRRMPLLAAVLLTVVSLAAFGVQSGESASWPGAVIGGLLGLMVWLPELLRRTAAGGRTP